MYSSDTMPAHYSLTPSAYDAVSDFIQDAELGPESLEEALQRVCEAIERFVNTYGGSNFLKDEPVHEFTALELRHKDDVQQKRTLLLRMTLKKDTAYVFAREELPLDEYYDVRKVITESGFSCYNDGARATPGF